MRDQEPKIKNDDVADIVASIARSVSSADMRTCHPREPAQDDGVSVGLQAPKTATRNVTVDTVKPAICPSPFAARSLPQVA